MHILPTHHIQNQMMVEVHYYSPYRFCLMRQDVAWGKMVYYWGRGNHSATDVERNATYGQEEYVDSLFAALKAKYVCKGIPVVLGEFAAYRRNIEDPANQALNHKSVECFNWYVVKTAISNGIIPYYRDTPMNLFNR